ncbi:pyrimidine dimer DNA glycosylase/endonuclease V [Geotalea toluenoxydans]
MRLWTLHPKYLDQKGLVALWREALLAQAVLRGQTRGYVHHPQLIRFRETAVPEASIAAYLQEVYREALKRGYAFDRNKIGPTDGAEPLAATSGQLEYEWGHLREKLRARSPSWLDNLESFSFPDPHPLFRIVPGPVADWEHVRP